MFHFVQGTTALQATQTAMAVVGHNIANANTKGYARQVTHFAERDPSKISGFLVGQGVKIADIERVHDALLQESIGDNASAQADQRARLELLRELENALHPGTGSLHDRVVSFFDELERLQTEHGGTQRQLVVDRAVEVATEMNALAGKLSDLRGTLVRRSESLVVELNSVMAELAQANRDVAAAETTGKQANALRGQRDQVLARLSALIDVRLVEPAKGPTFGQLAGGQVIVGDRPAQLQIQTDPSGELQLVQGSGSQVVTPKGGELAGTLAAYNDLLGGLESRLAEFTLAFVQAIDSVHATGIGTSGPFAHLRGERSVADLTVPLSTAESELPIEAGSLYITITELATGNQTLREVIVDPTTQSLNDVAAAISSIDHLQAVTSSQTNGLSLIAESGFAFDFTGRPESLPAGPSFTGTSVPKVEGIFAGATNESLLVQVVGSGTVGSTEGISLEVRDAAGDLIQTLNVGQGYVPGSRLQLASGVTLQLGLGSVNTGDSFSVNLVGQPDETGLLAALGLNTFFSGSSPQTLRVADSLIADAGRLGTSSNGQPAEHHVLKQLLDVRRDPTLGDGTLTLEAYLQDGVADVGRGVQEAVQLADSLSLVGEALEARRQEVSGVDVNEELVRMLELQRAFQAASRYITTVDALLVDLMRIIR